jgi:hypothetical protein
MKFHIELQFLFCSPILPHTLTSLYQLIFSDPRNKRVETPWVSKDIIILHIIQNLFEIESRFIKWCMHNFYIKGRIIISGGAMRSYRKWYRAHAWPEVTSPVVTWLFPYLFPYFPVFFPLFFSYFFSSYFFFPYFFSRTYFSRTIFPVFFKNSRCLKSNILKYQLVVFLVHVVIAQFMFLAE